MSLIPLDTPCNEPGCGHFYAVHHVGQCEQCPPFQHQHDFVPPPRLAGGAYTPDQEQAAYRRALRGEA